MLDIVATNDNKLTFPIEFENVDDIETAWPIAGSGRTNTAAENEPENVDEEQRGEQERDDCAEDRKKL